ncbi:hypothetical protein E4T56_gene19752, partial [Termitomyces sp. T112]
DWFWSNMEKGFILWHPEQHEPLSWPIPPRHGNPLGAVHNAPQTWDDGRRQNLFIRFERIEDVPAPLRERIRLDHVIIVAGLGFDEADIHADQVLGYRLHQWQDDGAGGVIGSSTAVGLGKPETHADGRVWAAHAATEIGNWAPWRDGARPRSTLSTYRGASLMPVIVTGAGGFVGRQIVSRLLAQGREVVAMDTVAGGIPAGARVIAGDLGNADVRAEALSGGVSSVIHLATVPGGAAEADPAASRRINIDAMYDLLLEASAAGNKPRFVYASSIAVYGDPLPAFVDDATPLSPKMIYGAHKAMMEHAVAMFANRGIIEGVTVRLPGILARPKGPSGMKSAFMSNLFHALKAGEEFVCPVSAGGTIWAQSVARCADNFIHALTLDTALLPPTYAGTLPAQRIPRGDLAGEIAAQCGVSPDLVRYEPDAALEVAFAAQPPLSTAAAEKASFAHDGDLATLVASALKTL